MKAGDREFVRLILVNECPFGDEGGLSDVEIIQ